MGLKRPTGEHLLVNETLHGQDRLPSVYPSKPPPTHMDLRSPPTVSMDDTMSGAREPRVSKLIGVGLSSSKHEKVRVVVRNFSLNGIGARGDVLLLPLERIIVHFPSGHDVEGIVRWVKKNTFGLLLDRPIDPNDLKPCAGAVGAIVPRDANLGFERMHHEPSTARSRFQRTHRDEVLRGSRWPQG